MAVMLLTWSLRTNIFPAARNKLNCLSHLSLCCHCREEHVVALPIILKILSLVFIDMQAVFLLSHHLKVYSWASQMPMKSPCISVDLCTKSEDWQNQWSQLPDNCTKYLRAPLLYAGYLFSAGLLLFLFWNAQQFLETEYKCLMWAIKFDVDHQICITLWPGPCFDFTIQSSASNGFSSFDHKHISFVHTVGCMCAVICRT